jgi:Mrp family chromosome partitioning ATPase/capsular polysaccharide biosynthesis protein
MTSAARPDYQELADYTGPVRRHWPTVVIGTLLGVVLAGAFYAVSPRSYTSQVEVQVSALQGVANVVGGRTNGPVNMDNEAQIVESAAVARIVALTPGLNLSPAEFSNRIKVTVPPNTQFMWISCVMPTARLAKTCASATGTGFLAQQTNALLTQARNQLTTIQNHALQVQSDQTVYNTRAKRASSTSARAFDYFRVSLDAAKLKVAEGKISALTAFINSLLPSGSTGRAGRGVVPASPVVGNIVTPATLPTSPSSPRKLLILPGGLALGLVAGLVAAYVRDRRRPRLHSARDAERLLGLPVLLSLTSRTAGPTTVLAPPNTPAGQACTELAQYTAQALGDGSHVILVAGVSPGAAGSVIAANLAAALARTRAETMLICGDIQQTSVPRLLSLGTGRGLAELLDGTASVQEVIWSAPDTYRFGVITPGLDPSSIPYTVRYDSVRQLLSQLQEEARYIVIELRSSANGDGMFSVAEFADAAIVVTEAEGSRMADITECLQRLDRLRTPVLGCAVLPPIRPAMPGARPEAAIQRRATAKQSGYSQHRDGEAAAEGALQPGHVDTAAGPTPGDSFSRRGAPHPAPGAPVPGPSGERDTVRAPHLGAGHREPGGQQTAAGERELVPAQPSGAVPAEQPATRKRGEQAAGPSTEQWQRSAGAAQAEDNGSYTEPADQAAGS